MSIYISERWSKTSLSNMDAPKVRILKNHTDIFKMDENVHLPRWMFLTILKK